MITFSCNTHPLKCGEGWNQLLSRCLSRQDFKAIAHALKTFRVQSNLCHYTQGDIIQTFKSLVLLQDLQNITPDGL
jgi:hypothetical protein